MTELLGNGLGYAVLLARDSVGGDAEGWDELSFRGGWSGLCKVQFPTAVWTQPDFSVPPPFAGSSLDKT